MSGKNTNILGDGIGYVELIDSMGNDTRVVNAARVSYNRETKGVVQDSNLIEYLIEHGHLSPFEHVMFTFRIKCPLIVARQWMRHRTWKYNEISRRYTQENIEFYFPEKWRKPDTVNKQGSTSGFNAEADEILSDILQDTVKNSFANYNLLLSLGVAREMARMVLPLNLYTTYYGTIDLRNLFGFFEQRLDSHAQWEIQQYAKAMLEFAEITAPRSIEAWKKYGLK